ncbi:MAG: S1C family serine protease [Haloferacaceae archaeon]
MAEMRRLLAVVTVLGLVVLAGCAGTIPGGPTQTSPTAAPTSAPSPAEPARSASTAAPSGSYAPLYRRTIASVVKIRVTTARSVVAGSGFVYDRRGDVVTNDHVIANARSVAVQFHDGTWENATVVGSDAYSDLAVVRVPSLPSAARPLPIARSDPAPGQPVAAIGNPFGLTGSITTGVVSGVHRKMPTAHSFTIPDTVQTSAAINPGNSGGPLLSRDGTVVGVNRATKGVNVGFAISPLVVRQVVPALIANGSYAHAYLGVSTETVTPSVAAANGLSKDRGVLVVRTLPNGPADGHLHGATSHVDEHGMRVPTGGDVIVAIDGTAVRNGEGLSRYLLLHTHPGERVPITVRHDGRRTTVHVTLGTRPRVTASSA